MFSIIVACDLKNGIGKDGSIPWHDSNDLKNFKKLTTNNIVIMGKKTFESIGNKPLPNRINCVISKTMYNRDDIKLFRDMWSCVKWCNKQKKQAFVCGGSGIYKWFDDNNLVSELYLTKIPEDYKCDVFYHPPNKEHYIIEQTDKYLHIKYKNLEETQIINLLSDILNNGVQRSDRTGTGTISLFGRQLRFNLKNNQLPLMTTRKIFFRGLFEELMMYLRGQTDTKILEQKNVNIWKGNTSREFLDSRNLQHLEVGDMGHSYGFSFRHFGAEYKGCNADYTDQGYDQLNQLLKGIKNDPNSRRHIISLWEPQHFHNAALPPCLYQYQFYVVNNQLSCMMTQRSSDIMVAGGWNVAAGSLLTILVAYYCNLEPNELIWNIGDAHIYNNLIEATKENINCQTTVFPKLFLKNMPKDITLVNYENLELINYKVNNKISVVLNV